jgi:hypothetical protein
MWLPSDFPFPRRGCIYVEPPAKVGSDAEVCWWVVDELARPDVEG